MGVKELFKRSLFTRVATAATLAVTAGVAPVVLGIGATPAHAAVVCVDTGNPVPSVTVGDCVANNDLFQVNVFVAQPNGDDPDAPVNNPPTVISISAAGVEAFADFSAGIASPQGELEVCAAGLCSGISSNGNPE